MNDNSHYEMCGYPLCAHFIEPNDFHEVTPGFGVTPIAEFIHLDDGEKEHDHDACRSGIIKTLAEWKEEWPALFQMYGDEKIGPNSKHFGPRPSLPL